MLVAATTENPSFSVVSPLLSRSLLLTLQPLDRRRRPRPGAPRAIADPRGLGGAVRLTEEAREHLVRLAGGDARRALTALEAAAGAALAARARPTAGRPRGRRARGGPGRGALRPRRRPALRRDQRVHQVASAARDVDAALHYLARMLEAGEDPRFIARRLMIPASEDIGMADPTALQTAVAAAQAVALIGMPEARITLAQAIVHLALAPKSNAVITAIGAAMADVRAGHGRPGARRTCATATTPGRRSSGTARATATRTTTRAAWSRQQYAPDELAGRDYYTPTDRGAERDLADPAGPAARDPARPRLTPAPAPPGPGPGRWPAVTHGRVAAGTGHHGRDAPMSVGRRRGADRCARLLRLRQRPGLHRREARASVLDETTLTIRGLSEGAMPLLTEVTTTVTTANHQLGKVGRDHRQRGPGVDQRLRPHLAVRRDPGSPVVKVAAFSYGVRQAVAGRDRKRGRR